MGHRPTAGIVDLGNNVRLATVPYQELPRYVMGNTWETADFVAYERPMWTTEGLYEECGLLIQPAYFAGETTQRPTLSQMLALTPRGSRCEFAGHLTEPPRLYLGAVDRKLHLHHAEAGLWNLMQSSYDGSQLELVRYRALGGSFINHWERLSNGVVVQTLTHLGGRVLYADVDGVSIARGPDASLLWLADPPTDSASWAHLREQLADARPNGRGGDLLDVFREFPDELVQLPGVTIWDIRPEGAGFRAMALLKDPVADAPPIRGLAPGTYVLSYSPSAGLTLRPAQLPRLVLSAPAIRGNAPAALFPTRAAVRVRNEGDHDVGAVTVAFMAGPAGGVGRLVGSAVVDVPAGAEVAAEATWIPAVAGEWELQAMSSAAGAAASPRTSVTVPRPPSVDLTSLLLAQGLRPFTVGAMTASLTLIAAMAVGLGLVVWHGGAASRRNAGDG
jgi:hypothetical protein